MYVHSTEYIVCLNSDLFFVAISAHCYMVDELRLGLKLSWGGAEPSRSSLAVAAGFPGGGLLDDAVRASQRIG